MRNRSSAIKRSAASAMLVLAALTWAPQAAAQKDPAPGFPSKSLRMVVPFAAGDVLDVVTRLITPRLNETWNVPVIVDNKPGATGNIGMDFVAKSAPDGYTMGILIISHSVNAALTGPKMPYDILRDLTPIAQLTGNAYVLSVNPKLPVKSVSDLVAYARANPGAVRYGSSGTGGVIHLAGELLAQLSKVKMTHVPYKGNAPAIMDIVGGHIEFMFSSLTLAAPLNAKGQVRSLAVSSAQRMAAAPDLPTMQEAGVAGFEVNGWYGIAGPARIPANIVDKLNREIVRAVNLPATREKLGAAGLQVVGSTPAQFGALLKAEHEKWRRVGKESGLVVN